MHITLESKIRIQDPTPEVRKFIKETLTLPNPLWEKLRRMGNTRALYGCPKDFKYYEESKDGRVILCPRGIRGELQQRFGILIEREHGDSESKDQARDLHSSIVLRPYQEGIVEEVTKHKEGIIKLGTGFGKTIIALKIAQSLGLRTLIIVPRLHIKAAFEKEIERYFGFDPKGLEAPITVSTLQSLQRAAPSVHPGTGEPGIQGGRSSQRYGTVIVDEAHTTVPAKSRKVIQSFAPEYLYGMTATPRRTDGQGKAIEFIYGKILTDRELPRKAPTVAIVCYAGHIPSWDFPGIIAAQTQDPERNALIARIVEREASRGRRCLVLTKRIAHYEFILHKLRESSSLPADSIIALRSSGTADARARELDDLRSGRRDFSVLLGTFSLLSTGVDIPQLSTLIIAGDLKSDVLAEQSAGRVLRLLEGKADPVIIDIVDLGQPILKRQGQARRKFYESQGWPIEYEKPR